MRALVALTWWVGGGGGGKQASDIEFLYNAASSREKHYKTSKKDENKKMDKRVFL